METTKKQKVVWDGYEIALSRYDAGNYEGALTLLLNADEDGHASPHILELIAAIYFDIEMYRYSVEYWLRYLSIVSRADCKAKAYNALAACYCRLDMPGPMTYWYEEQLKVCGPNEMDYDYVLMDYYDAVNDAMPDEFYSVDNPPCDKIAWEGSVLISEGEYEEAIKKLQSIPETDERYTDAQLNVVACLSVIGEEEKSVETLKSLVEKKPESGAANLAYAAYFFDSSRLTESRYYADKADECGLEDEEDMFRLAFLLLSFGEEDKALKQLDDCLSISPYFLKALILKGELFYNRGDKKKAAEVFKKLYDVTRGATARYYYNISVSESGDLPKKLEYGVILPKEEAAARFAHVALIIAGGEKIVKAEKKEVLTDLADWCLFYPNALQCEFVRTLLVSGNKMRGYLIDKLVSPRVDSEAKFAIIEGLARSGYNKKISAEITGVYFTTKIVPADLGADLKNNVFADAYSFAYSKICLFDDRADELIDYACDMFYYALDNHTFDRADDKNALAAAMLYTGGYGVIKQKGFIEHVLMTSKKKMKEMLSITGGTKNE